LANIHRTFRGNTPHCGMFVVLGEIE
jgi:hypothetical protein